MKPNTLLTLLFCLCFSTFIQAQNVEKLAKVAAEELCDCVNESYGNIDNDVKVAMMTIIEYQMNGQEQKIEDYANSLSADLTERIEAQAELFQEDEEDLLLCVEDIESSLAKVAADNKEAITEDEFVELLLIEMEDMKACEFAYLIMELSMAQEENGANNGQVDNQNANPSPSSYDKELHGSGGN